MIFALIGTLAGFFPFTLAVNANLPGDIHVPVLGEASAIAWNEKNQNLYFLKSGTLHEWPSGKTRKLGLPNIPLDGPDYKLAISSDGKKFFVSDTFENCASGYLSDWKTKPRIIKCDNAWWIGSDLVTLKTQQDPDISILTSGKNQIVVKGLLVQDGDQNTVLSVRYHDADFTSDLVLLTIDFRTDSYKIICDYGPIWSEHYAHSIVWNPALQCAVMGVPGDTAEITKNPWVHFLSREMPERQGVSMPSSMISTGAWYGSRYIYSSDEILGDFVEQRNLIYVLRIASVDPKTGKSKDIVKYQSKDVECSTKIGTCALSTSSSRLAWFESTPQGNRIVIRKLDPEFGKVNE